MSCGTDITGDEDAGTDSAPGNPGQFVVDFPNLLCAPVLRELIAVCPEGSGVDDICAGVSIGLVDIREDIGMFQTPQFRAYPAGHSALLQLGSRGAVQDQDSLFQKAANCFLGFHRISPRFQNRLLSRIF
ncbi:MAG: hypothetical protein A4E66_00420 [Syntrophus sp. PtaB.Bin001]|nr:MAG: hypothetical protein A4E66_00420 [Syntrophus sp. PtaB.Bin001]